MGEGAGADASARAEAGLGGSAESSLRGVTAGRHPPTVSSSSVLSPFIQQVFVECPTLTRPCAKLRILLIKAG